jgi:PAS domain S-box-containing protein
MTDDLEPEFGERDTMIPGALHVPPAHIADPAPPHQAPSDIFFAAVKMTRMPMTVTDPHQPDNPIIFCNDAFTFMTGYTEAEILGKNCRFLQGPETDRVIVDQIRTAISRRQEVAVEILNYRKNGSTFWNALFVSPVFGEDGRLLYYFGSQLDISRRREAEEALHEAQKMEAVGKLTGGIAHDFNNLLQVILGYVDIIGARVGEDRRLTAAVEAIGSAATRGATLTQQLLAFARKQELRDRLLNFNSLVADFRPILDRSAGDGLSLKCDFEENLWNCRVDPVQAEMALLNLVANARDAMRGQGEVTITTHNAVLPQDAPELRLDAGEYVVVCVSDDGPGVPRRSSTASSTRSSRRRRSARAPAWGWPWSMGSCASPTAWPGSTAPGRAVPCSSCGFPAPPASSSAGRARRAAASRAGPSAS